MAQTKDSGSAHDDVPLTAYQGMRRFVVQRHRASRFHYDLRRGRRRLGQLGGP